MAHFTLNANALTVGQQVRAYTIKSIGSYVSPKSVMFKVYH